MDKKTHNWWFTFWDFLIKTLGPFLWIRFNYLKAAEALRRGILILTNKSTGTPGTHLIYQIVCSQMDQ